MDLLRKKHPHELHNHQNRLRQCLSALDLTLLGIGAIIGAGIFVLTGIAAATRAGPAIVLSYIIAGMTCAFSALAYAELASSVGGCGSAYSYAYAGFGEVFAWIIGWDLLLEYAVSVSAVSVGWSGYVNDLFTAMHVHIPFVLLHSPLNQGYFNLPALLAVLFLTVLLYIGVKASARFNNFIVLIKLLVIVLFIVIAALNINPANWHPFLPFGWSGIMSGAALIFFAYIGFDAVSTAAEEARNPQKDLPIGIIASLVVCTILYIVVSALLTSIVPFYKLNVSSPISYSLLQIGHHFAAGITGVGAIAGLTTVMLVMYYGLTRVFYAMSRDCLLPESFAVLHPKTQTPTKIILLCGLTIGLFSALVPISDLAELVNVGTLFAFATVSLGVIILRYKQPFLKRPFKTPFSPLVPILGILTSFYLIANLPTVTLIRFFAWMALGLIVYFFYGRYHSLMVEKVEKN